MHLDRGERAVCVRWHGGRANERSILDGVWIDGQYFVDPDGVGQCEGNDLAVLRLDDEGLRVDLLDRASQPDRGSAECAMTNAAAVATPISVRVRSRGIVLPSSVLQSDRLAACPPRSVKTPQTGARSGKKQEDEAVQHRSVAAVQDREQRTALGCVGHEIADRHFARQDERHGAHEEADHDKRTPDQFEQTRNTDERGERDMVEARYVRKPEQLGTAMEEEEITGDDAQKRVRAGRPKIWRQASVGHLEEKRSETGKGEEWGRRHGKATTFIPA